MSTIGDLTAAHIGATVAIGPWVGTLAYVLHRLDRPGMTVASVSLEGPDGFDLGDLASATPCTVDTHVLDAVAALESAEPAPDAWRGCCTRGVCAAEDGHAGTCAEASGWADEPDRPTWDDIEWERVQCDRRIAEVRSLAEVAIDRERRIDAASRTVADRVWRAAMERRKVLRVADLIEGVERVIV